jgi:hypothetical protein
VTRPDRRVLGVHVDPRGLMKATRALASIAGSEPVVLARITPFYFDLAPDQSAYYPIYAKCIALGLPLAINTGIPGPPAPAACQNPIHLDRVCLDFPELVLVMAHGADPWWNVAIRLMLECRNLYLKTSAYAPKYFPPELLHFMNTRGQDKGIFASDHPALSMERALGEARALELRPGVASFDENAPTPLGTLDAGANVLSGTATSFTDWGDVFTIEVPVELAITSIEVQISAHTGGFDAATKVFEAVGLEGHFFPAGGSHSFTAIVPLAASGPYGFTAQFSGAGAGESYAWQWTITVPEPSSDALSLTAGALLLLAAGARRDRTRGAITAGCQRGSPAPPARRCTSAPRRARAQGRRA